VETVIEKAVADLGEALFAEAVAIRAELIRLQRRDATLARAEVGERRRARPGRRCRSRPRLEDLSHLRSSLASDLVTAEVEAEMAAAAWRRHRDKSVIIEARLRRRRAAALLSITL
jgi:hypothetical protein